jgi:AcrR family transcriptional regulator
MSVTAHRPVRNIQRSLIGNRTATLSDYRGGRAHGLLLVDPESGVARMSSSARRVGRPPASGRDRDARADIHDAALTLFAEQGFDRTSMRAVAARAGVDVALIYYHFGSKDQLLDAALSVPAAAERVRVAIPADTPDPAKVLVRAALELWEHDADLRRRAAAMLRAAVSHELAAQRLQTLHTAYVLDLVHEVVATDQRELRAGLIGTQLHGLLMGRYLLSVPSLTSPSIDGLVDAVAPAIDHFLTGELTPR